MTFIHNRLIFLNSMNKFPTKYVSKLRNYFNMLYCISKIVSKSIFIKYKSYHKRQIVLPPRKQFSGKMVNFDHYF